LGTAAVLHCKTETCAKKLGSCREPIGRYGEQNSIARYRGYSACPIPTAYGKLMLADLIIQILKNDFSYQSNKTKLGYVDSLKLKYYLGCIGIKF
jgi:hypothetical protein